MPHPLASLIQPKRRPEPPPPPKKEKKQKPPSYDGPQFLKDIRPFFYPIDGKFAQDHTCWCLQFSPLHVESRDNLEMCEVVTNSGP